MSSNRTEPDIKRRARTFSNATTLVGEPSSASPQPQLSQGWQPAVSYSNADDLPNDGDHALLRHIEANRTDINHLELRLRWQSVRVYQQGICLRMNEQETRRLQEQRDSDNHTVAVAYNRMGDRIEMNARRIDQQGVEYRDLLDYLGPRLNNMEKIIEDQAKTIKEMQEARARDREEMAAVKAYIRMPAWIDVLWDWSFSNSGNDTETASPTWSPDTATTQEDSNDTYEID